MSDTVEVVAAKELRLPTGHVEKGELFPTTAANVSNLTALDMLVLAEAKDDKDTLVKRAIRAGADARKDLDARFAKEAKEQADAEAAAAKAAEAAEAKAAKKAPTSDKEG